jgi:hypothetical protein
MGLQQLWPAGDEGIARQAGGQVHPYTPAQGLCALLLKHGLQLVHIGQQVLAALVKRLAILHELHLARGAVQQARA